MLIVDTNVVIDVLEKDPTWAAWSTRQLDAQVQVRELLINPVIYSELSLAFGEIRDLDQALEDMGIELREVPRAALFLAGRAFLTYRRTEGTKHNVLPDFFIGAHAAVLGCPILTRDAARYRNYFPTVRLITPDRG